MGLDRLDYANTGVTDLNKLTPKARKFLNALELATGVPVDFAGTGFGTPEVVQDRVSHIIQSCHV
jgi:adenylosuccinate synthase